MKKLVLLESQLVSEANLSSATVGRPSTRVSAILRCSRLVVEINLRAPHMVHSKKSFKRLLWSAENVLNNNLACLFCNLNQSSNNFLLF